MFASCSKLSYVLIAIMSSRSPVKKTPTNRTMKAM